MSPAQIFGIVVRTLGLGMTVYGAISSTIGFLGIFFGGFMLLVFGLPIMLFGLWLLRGPRLLIAYAYPDERA
ncbi:MAG TPA: hypothetical protein VMF30_02485 [Pirellulales bacterium]|nr:hypothetical protein [Pirellulales bacterium]